MSVFLPLVPVEKETYTREYLIPAECFECNAPVTLHAECSLSSEADRSMGHYELSFYFSVGNYPTRDFLITLFFGTQALSRTEIDETIDRYARSQIDDTFPDLVSNYMDKELIWEDVLDARLREREEDDSPLI